MVNNEIYLIVLLSAATMLPFIVASGSCYIKFSIVLVLVRNALGLPQVPSNLALNSIALIMSLFVMMPVMEKAHHYLQEHHVDVIDSESLNAFINDGLGGYKQYLQRYSDPKLVEFFQSAQSARAKLPPVTMTAIQYDLPTIYSTILFLLCCRLTRLQRSKVHSASASISIYRSSSST